MPDRAPKNGLTRKEHYLHIRILCKTPAKAPLAKETLERFDLFATGLNDFTQPTPIGFVGLNCISQKLTTSRTFHHA